MERLLQQFERPIVDGDGDSYDVYLYGRSRPGDTWQGWLVFERASDRTRFATDVETTQPNAEAILYWATGLTEAYFDGALDRAKRPVRRPAATVDALPPEDSVRRAIRVHGIERDILTLFARYRVPSMLTQVLFDNLSYSHADIVRALEELEKQARMIVRRTEEGNDWLFLTENGVRAAGLTNTPHVDQSMTADPPDSAR